MRSSIQSIRIKQWCRFCSRIAGVITNTCTTTWCKENRINLHFAKVSDRNQQLSNYLDLLQLCLPRLGFPSINIHLPIVGPNFQVGVFSDDFCLLAHHQTNITMILRLRHNYVQQRMLLLLLLKCNSREKWATRCVADGEAGGENDSTWRTR
jgi:hypothetical protein